MNKIDELSITIPAQMTSSAAVDNFIELVIDSFKLPSFLMGCITIAIINAVRTYILYGNNGKQGKTLTLTATKHPTNVVICVEDEGGGLVFKGINAGIRLGDANARHGDGLYLIATLADELVFLNKSSKVSMTFFLNETNP